MAGTLDDFMRIANGEVGKTDGSKYGAGSAEWCAYFVCWCAAQAGIGTIQNKYAPPYVPSNLTSAPAIATWYLNSNRLLAPRTSSTSSNRPQVGDIAIIDVYKRDGDQNHVGIVVEVSGSGSSMTVKCVEGNISGGKVGTVTYTNLKIKTQGISYLASNHVESS